MAERKDQWSYANGKTPADYRCAKCSESGVRLYRQWNTFVEHIQLLCTACALQDQHKAAPDSPHTIGYLAAAVPCEEHDTYWGHCSVPLSGVRWWERLPVRQEKKATELKPCPFCGNKIDNLHVMKNTYGDWVVWCNNHWCSVNGPAKDTKAEAIAAWNERSDNAN